MIELKSDYSQKNKKIAINTLIVYARMIIVTLISLITVRYVLKALGASDYGLYNVVGGVVAILNFICTAMQTTTRRYINIEMGKINRNLNKIFNVCLLLHVGFAILLLIIVETIGNFYIYNYLNVAPEKLQDASFVFQISAIVSIIGIINVPYQGLLSAYEKFGTIASIDFVTTLLKIPLVVCLAYFEGNALRFYAIGTCLISFSSFILYSLFCYKHYSDIVKFKTYKDWKLCREIIAFNNYTAIGAFAYIGRTQGSNIMVNYFFGTIINGAFALAYQIENNIMNFVGNLATSFEPQITQSYSNGDYKRCYSLVSKISRYCILIMLFVLFPLILELEFILKIWLGNIPSGVILLSYLTLLSLFVRSLTGGLSPLILATGDVKKFQISASFLMLIGLPLAFIAYYIHSPYFIIIIIMTILDLINRGYIVYLASIQTSINIHKFISETYKPVCFMLPFMILYILVDKEIELVNYTYHIVNLLCAFIFIGTLGYIFGLDHNEKKLLIEKIRRHNL